MLPLRSLVAAPVLAALALAATPAVAPARTATVRIADLDFSKPVVHIQRGDRVRWTWHDGTTPHDVTSTGRPRFRSSQTKDRGTHTVRFIRTGTYRYRCTIHLNMRAKIVVGR